MKVRRTLLLGVFCAVVSGAVPAMAALSANGDYGYSETALAPDL